MISTASKASHILCYFSLQADDPTSKPSGSRRVPTSWLVSRRIAAVKWPQVATEAAQSIATLSFRSELQGHRRSSTNLREATGS